MEKDTENFDTVDKFMKEYLKDENAIDDLSKGEELTVNFEIEYPDNSGVCSTDSIYCDDKDDCCNQNDFCDNKIKEEYYGNCESNDGEIEVICTLNNVNGKRIIGLTVKLYKINEICTSEIQEGVTDCNGVVKFSNLEDGTYRVVQLIDCKYFDKPKYVNWNEVVIDNCNKCAKIYAVNTIRCCAKKR